MDILRALLGIAVLIAICYAFSIDRKNIDWRLVIIGILMQFGFAVLVLWVPFVKTFLDWISSGFSQILVWTNYGSAFVFGDMLNMEKFGFIFAFQVLPAIVFFSALTSLLYYLGWLQKIVYGFAWLMSRTMRLSGAESLAAAANVFIGQTEAPLVVKPYLSNMTRSEIMCLMTGGMATIAGSVFIAYMGILGGTDPENQIKFGTHLLTASIMSAPAAIVAAKILFPESHPDKVNKDLNIPKEKIGSNVLEAISNGTTEGLKLAVNVAAMLIVFMALVDMLNFFALKIGNLGLNGVISAISGGQYEVLSFQAVLGIICAPVAWLLGVPSIDIMKIGQLIGEKAMLNEFIAYTSLGEMKSLGSLQAKSIMIATYALCGFANFGSIGIQIGGIGSLAPNQRATLSEFGMRALLGGTVAALMTAAIAGMFYMEGTV